MKKLSALLLTVMCLKMANAQDSTVSAGRKDTLPSIIDTSTMNVDTSAAKALPITVPDSTPSTPTPSSPTQKPTVAMPFVGKAQDHLLIQIGYDNWTNKNDSIRMKGISRSFAMYFMYDFPIKSSPHFSIGLGLGVSSTNMYFSNTDLDITGSRIKCTCNCTCKAPWTLNNPPSR